MANTINPVSLEALKLSPKKRMGLATLLLESLDDSSAVDPKLLREGKVKGLTTEEAYGFSLA